MFEAVKANDCVKMGRLLQSGVDVNVRYVNGVISPVTVYFMVPLA